MTATAKFYTGLAVVLAIIIAVSFAIGYRVGFSHAEGIRVTSHGAHRMTAVPPSP